MAQAREEEPHKAKGSVRRQGDAGQQVRVVGGREGPVVHLQGAWKMTMP